MAFQGLSLQGATHSRSFAPWGQRKLAEEEKSGVRPRRTWAPGRERRAGRRSLRSWLARWPTPSRKLGVERPSPAHTSLPAPGWATEASKPHPILLGTSWPRSVCLLILLPPPPARPPPAPRVAPEEGETGPAPDLLCSPSFLPVGSRASLDHSPLLGMGSWGWGRLWTLKRTQGCFSQERKKEKLHQFWLKRGT